MRYGGESTGKSECEKNKHFNDVLQFVNNHSSATVGFAWLPKACLSLWCLPDRFINSYCAIGPTKHFSRVVIVEKNPPGVTLNARFPWRAGV